MTTRKRIGLRMPHETNTKLSKLATKMGISKNAIILQAIYEYLERR